ncbi:MAG: type I methionyl aminopeptidase [Eubacteriales bacterium]|nr:type I methionyl aminopeptidase [Eubacteriales bacterium]MDD3881665.1 type I methionyl aminopeptidase [Eubacteriales bacterium]MDD4512276.1 type I methionyl aminopeptidase [Eubacteriales bacterium]
MISIKNPSQIEKMRRAGALLHDVLMYLRSQVRPGISTLELDAMAEKMMREHNAIPSCKGYEGFPYTLCTSINSEIVHGFPSKRRLEEGDILSIDTCLILDGWQSDSAITVPVGRISAEAQRLIDLTEECFWKGVRLAVAGNRVGDISSAVETCAKSYGCKPVRALCGHGIGREMHEDPEVPNFGEAGHGPRLREGMVICIEPMISAGTWQVKCQSNDWTYEIADGSLSSHYEHTIAINANGMPELLTYPEFSWETAEFDERGVPKISQNDSQNAEKEEKL